MTLLRYLVAGGTLLAGSAAIAQDAAPIVAVPPLSTPADKPTPSGSTAALAWQASKLIASDLQSATELMPIPPDQKDFYSYPEVTAPTFAKWRGRAGLLVTGFVQARADGRVTFGCYVYDVQKGRELDRTGFAVDPQDWRRAAHKCSGLAYKAATGAPGIFDTRIAYVSESGTGDARVRRIALMDSDGYDHSFITAGETMVLTPRLSPSAARVAYVSYMTGRPQVRVRDVGSGAEHSLVPGDAMTFAPRFSPDGNRIAFSMTIAGNTDIYVVDSSGGMPRRLTTAPGVDTDPSFSPDGTRILFESDRSGDQQVYAMNADGSDQRRLSFGAGAHAAPDWSPAGDRIAFTWRGGGSLRVGVMNADGSDEHVLTSGPSDEGATWGPSGRDMVFQRSDGAGRRSLYRISIAGGGDAQQIATPQDASDPDWSGPVD
ncbi:Tol-Pal system beta propeller repeat protein TolB [Sphingomonas sp.]|uniref:Tol-Pal system beta propeller repeat protein TolB n=1 Tax=Sphingomonas sp. TaxID=28214 RepID=UPI0025E7A7D1|nr:Tol-Pal system beta propeller repeat protein TolB [Sphingomonas sp.]MBV9529407.1 Tol-Pal system protein TolB [Sphingomonas sp.]